MATPPPVHVPRPYDRPEARLAFRVDVPLSDGALVATFVYCPDDTPDDAEWAFLPTPVLMMSSSTASGTRSAHATRNSASSAQPRASIPACLSAYTAISRMFLSSST